MNPEECPTCGAKMVEYKHGLNKGLAAGLRAIARVGEARLSELGLNRNQIDNFQKLRYWGFVRQVEVDGVRKAGVWAITDAGRQFVEGRPARRYVWTYRGERRRFEGEKVSIDEVESGYKQRTEYAAEAMPG